MAPPPRTALAAVAAPATAPAATPQLPGVPSSLAPPRPAPPVSLLASKSWLGHAEPAAGLVAVAQTTAALQGHARMPILHLSTLNPYVSSVLEAAR